MASSNAQTITTGVTEEVGEFLWEIKNYFLVQQDKTLVEEQQIQVEVGKSAENLTKWQIALKVSPNQDQVRMTFKLLEISGSSQTVFAKFEAESIPGDGAVKPLFKLTSNAEILKEVQGPCNMSFKLNDPERWTNSLDKEGTITRRIKITVVQTSNMDNVDYMVTTAMRNFKKKSVSRLQKNLASILEGGLSPDVKIICSDGNELTAQRVILSGSDTTCDLNRFITPIAIKNTLEYKSAENFMLIAARSPVFRSMLCPKNNYTECRTGVIQVDDISSTTMGILLNYVYTGELLSHWCDAEVIKEFVYAAGKYELTEVLVMLDEVLGLQKGIDYDLALLAMTHKLNLNNAEAQIREKIVKLAISAETGNDLISLFKNQVSKI